jgi:hypothetical protein
MLLYIKKHELQFQHSNEYSCPFYEQKYFSKIIEKFSKKRPKSIDNIFGLLNENINFFNYKINQQLILLKLKEHFFIDKKFNRIIFYQVLLNYNIIWIESDYLELI